ncbi:proton-associated sugar transporter A-like [Lytechinus variegatus]|uniref:proton-associated sugar transporter A-like n=1 Tax=Lytechinus variegatus TaxID=7654 RepID=UPI001BB16786|nr:proton-associated sugar transporter A-like [Lytechinus variegatus]
MDVDVQHPHDSQYLGRRKPKKTLWQLLRLNASVFGVAFGYAVATSLATPLLLALGLPNQLFGIGWLGGPVMGYFLSPIIMATSERCRSSWGRRRPFLLVLGMGLIVGVVLFLNGRDIGFIITDDTQDRLACILLTVFGLVLVDFCSNASDIPSKAYLVDVCDQDDFITGNNIRIIFSGLGGGVGYIFVAIDWMSTSIGGALGSQLRVICLFNVAFLSITLALTLFSIPETAHQAEQQTNSSSLSAPVSYTYVDNNDEHVQPSSIRNTSVHVNINVDERQPLLGEKSNIAHSDLPTPERPLKRNAPSRKTIRDRSMCGYDAERFKKSAARNPEPSHLEFFPNLDGNDVQIHDNFAGGPFRVSSSNTNNGLNIDFDCDVSTDRSTIASSSAAILPVTSTTHGDASSHGISLVAESSSAGDEERMLSSDEKELVSVKHLMMSAIFMPCVLRKLMFCSYISWIAFLTMLLYFTDFIGCTVYLGDPSASSNSTAYSRYQHGVKMGCWGLCVFSFSAAISSLVLKFLEKRWSLRTIYVFGQLIYAVGIGSMFLTISYPFVTISLCVTFGIKLAVIRRIPECIIAAYHRSHKFKNPDGGLVRSSSSDLAGLGSQVLFAQITVSTLIGPIVHSTGTRLALVVFASSTAFISCILSACFVNYEL